MLGLLDAITKFDLRRDYRLSTFAHLHIAGKIRDEVKGWRRRGQTGETRADRWLYDHPAASAEEIMAGAGCDRKASDAALKRAKGYWHGFKSFEDVDSSPDLASVRRHSKKRAEGAAAEEAA